MMGQTHVRVVTEAASFLKRIVGAAENSLSPASFLAGVDPGGFKTFLGAVAQRAPGPARETDDFHDLYVASTWMPLAKPLGEAFRECFTKWSHFVDMRPQPGPQWRQRDGYCFGGSARIGLDKLVMQGLSHATGAGVHMGKSTILSSNAVGGDWQGPIPYEDNFGGLLDETVFPPASSLARCYYKWFLANLLSGKVDVGDGKCLRGPEILGPVFHALADACVPTHVRPTLDCWHQGWENSLEAAVAAGEIKPSDPIVLGLLEQLWPTVANGAGDVGDLVVAVASGVRDHLVPSFKDGPSGPWNASSDDWKAYTRNCFDANPTNGHPQWLYQLAIAATACAIVRAYVDVNRKEAAGWEARLAAVPMAFSAVGADRSSVPWTDPFAKPETWLGFKPGDSLRDALGDLVKALDESSAVSQGDLAGLIDRARRAMVEEFARQPEANGKRFCPAEAASKGRGPTGSTITSFRPPTDEETAAGMEQYTKLAEAHHRKACILLGVWAEAVGWHLKATDAPAEPRSKSWSVCARTLATAPAVRTLLIPTFDDGPICVDLQNDGQGAAMNELLAPLHAILETLDKRKLLAVFYVAWARLAGDGGGSIARQAFRAGLDAIRRGGHVIALHTHDHSLYKDPFLADASRIEDDLDRLKAELGGWGKPYQNLWRAPYGGLRTLFIEESAIAAAKGLAYRKWRVDSFDWCYHPDGMFPGIDVQDWKDWVSRSIRWDVFSSGGLGKPWADILMHVNRRTADDLDWILGRLEQRYQDVYPGAWGGEFGWLRPADRGSASFQHYLSGPAV